MPKEKRSDFESLIAVMSRIDRDPYYLSNHKQLIKRFKFSGGLLSELDTESDFAAYRTRILSELLVSYDLVSA